MSKTHIGVEPGSHEITITRDFDAPVDLVFRAHADPELIAKWLGPHGLTTVVETYDVRDGGQWRMIHSDDQGNEAAFRGVFHGSPSPDNFVRTFEFEGMPGHVALETLRLEDLGDGKTRVHASSVFQTVADRDGMAASGMEKGVNEGYERLDELLASLAKTV